MPYFKTILAHTFALGIIVGTNACSDEGKGTSERDGSVNEGNGTGATDAGGASSAGNNASGTSGGGNNNSGTSSGGTTGDDNTNGDDTNSNGAGNGSSAGTGGTSSGTSGSTSGGTGSTCGGFAGIPCPDGLFCNVEREAGGAGCETPDGTGVCQERPSGCPGIYDPVCSCDIRTHSNACAAHGNGSSVLHKGACTVAECQMIGGRVVADPGSGAACQPGEVGFELAGGVEPFLCCVKE